jgi:hypothetical protein
MLRLRRSYWTLDIQHSTLDILRFDERVLFHRIITGEITGTNPGFTWIIQVVTSGHVLLMMLLKESVNQSFRHSVIKFSLKK